MIGKPTFRASHNVNPITILLIGIIIPTSILFVFTLVLNQNQTAIAQQQELHGMQNNQMSSSLTNQQLLNGNSFSTLSGYRHDPRVVGKMAGHVALPWIHRVFALMKRWGLGTDHGLHRKHVDSYLNELLAKRFKN
jgi:hypothetical protein